MNSKTNWECNWDSKSLEDYKSAHRIKKQMRKANWTYLQRHPEIRAIIRFFIHELINKNPENIYQFASILFSFNNTPLLVSKINKQLKIVNKKLKSSRWCQYDAEELFSNSQSSHSILSRLSIAADINAMLQYAVILRDAEKTNS